MLGEALGGFFRSTRGGNAVRQQLQAAAVGVPARRQTSWPSFQPRAKFSQSSMHGPCCISICSDRTLLRSNLLCVTSMDEWVEEARLNQACRWTRRAVGRDGRGLAQGPWATLRCTVINATKTLDCSLVNRGFCLTNKNVKARARAPKGKADGRRALPFKGKRMRNGKYGHNAKLCCQGGSTSKLPAKERESASSNSCSRSGPGRPG